MIEQANTRPIVDVALAEYKRLLGYPRSRALRGRARELAHWARRWYTEHGRPWTYLRQTASLDLRGDSVVAEGVVFNSQQLQRILAQAQAGSVVLVAVGAGHEIEQQAQEAWQRGLPDEYFFLEVFGSSVVEQLITMVGASLCAWAEINELAVLPHYSPGYPGWDVAEQTRLLELIRQVRQHGFPFPLKALESGMLSPKKSQLAVFGLTRQIDQVRRLTELVPCERCSFLSCQYRRIPYARSNARRKANATLPPVPELADAIKIAKPLDHHATYTTNAKALKRWADERLTLERHSDGSLDAVFRYDGTTCTNMGRPLSFDYHVKLGTRQQRFPILYQTCQPAPDSEGYKSMCRYIEEPTTLMAAVTSEKPLSGQPLDDVLSWDPRLCNSGCYCEQGDRMHKWRLVLETIHYALVQQEKQASNLLE